MKPILAFLSLLITANMTAGEFKHDHAVVNVPGSWEQVKLKDKDDKEDKNDKALRLKSQDGQQELLVLADVPDHKIPEWQLEQVAEFAEQSMLRALELLPENDVQLDESEVSSLHGSVKRAIRAHSKGKKSRIAIRVEATPKRVRTTVLFDRDTKSREDFATWSKTILDGVK